MSENLLKLVEMIEKRGNLGLAESVAKLKVKFMPKDDPSTEENEAEDAEIDGVVQNEERVVLHITYSKSLKGWKILLEGEENPIQIERTKKEAISRSKEILSNFRKAQVIIHKKDGKIQKEYTYGDDPTQTKG